MYSKCCFRIKKRGGKERKIQTDILQNWFVQQMMKRIMEHSGAKSEVCHRVNSWTLITVTQTQPHRESGSL